VASQAARRQAFAVLRAGRDGEMEWLLDQGKPYQAVLRAREAWKARHGEELPAAGCVLGVAEHLAAQTTGGAPRPSGTGARGRTGQPPAAGPRRRSGPPRTPSCTGLCWCRCVTIEEGGW